MTALKPSPLLLAVLVCCLSASAASATVFKGPAYMCANIDDERTLALIDIQDGDQAANKWMARNDHDVCRLWGRNKKSGVIIIASMGESRQTAIKKLNYEKYGATKYDREEPLL